MVLDLLLKTEALQDGHFLLSSGRHSNRYCQCAKLLSYPQYAEKVCKDLATKLRDLNIDIVVGPAMGGIIVAYELARQLGARAMFTERVDNIMCLRRGFDLKEKQRVLICEDVVTTGKSTLETIKALEKYNVDIVGVASIIDRSRGSDLGFKLYSALSLDVDNFEAENCPLCRENTIALVKPGSRKM